MSAPWLLKLGIGGVQEFISQATKVRELASGSRIISRLARAAAAAAAQEQAEIVLPASASADHCPHQIVALLADGTRDAATGLGNRMSAAARQSWMELATTHGPRYLRPPFTAIAEAAAIDDHFQHAFEIYWVALPIRDSYAATFADLLRAFEDRRFSRTFPQLAGFVDHPTWSCSQCGSRAAVVQAPAGGWPTDSRFAKGNERLCAVCALKRTWSEAKLGGAYPSTHRLARSRYARDPGFGPLREEIRSRCAASAAESGQALDPARVQEDLLDDLDEIRELLVEGNGAGPAAPPAATDSRSHPADRSHGTAAAALVRHPALLARLLGLSPYYALVIYDGDRMGRWLSGEHFSREQDRRAAQDQLSRALLGFAKEVARAVAPHEPHGARLIYAGGDDGLLVVPLDFLLPVCRAIKEAWERLRRAAAPLTPPAPPAAGRELPTLSLHASLVHAKAPLQPAVRRLHELLDDAKERGGRNCTSILCAIHSGAEVRWIGAWQELDRLAAAVEAFSTWRSADIDRPGDGELASRKAASLPARLLYSCLDAGADFLGAEMPSSSFERELDRLASGSGGPVAAETATWREAKEWFLARATYRGNGSPPLGAAEAFDSAVQTVAFLARELAWERVA